MIGHFVSVLFYVFLDVRKEEEQKGQGKTREEEERKMWIRKEPDPDGYFLLQLVKKTRWDDDIIRWKDCFLTAEDASSLTVARK